jgi:membrane fusion protein, type I secretion system
VISLRKTSASSNRTGSLPPAEDDGIRANLTIGLVVIILLVGGFGTWAATASLAGAVLAQGTVAAGSSVKKVQHPTGGVVADIRVRDGDVVGAGDLLVRLDETVTRANLQVITKQLDELATRQGRLRAERDGLDVVQVPESLTDRKNDPGISEMIAAESALFESRRNARARQKDQLQERITQLCEEIVGLTAQTQAKERELALVAIELEGVEQLWNKKLMPISKVTAMRREAARLDGDRAQLTAQGAMSRGKIAEIKLQLIQIDQDLRTEVMKDLREAQAKDAELVERRAAAEDQLKRVEIRAPQAGIVHQLAVHTIGGVINASEPIMLIVPADDTLIVEARVAPQEIDHVRIGQEAFVRFPAFNQRTTPEFKAEVMMVSADSTKDASSNQTFYLARLRLSDDFNRTGQLKLVPGMPAEVHMRTTARSPLSYLVKPLSDQIARAFKE